MKDAKFDFPTSQDSLDKIFLGDMSTAWDVYPDNPMSATDFLDMISELCAALKDTETVKYRFVWEGGSSYIKVGRYEIETVQQFSMRQQRLQAASMLKHVNAELEAEVNRVIEQIPAHLRHAVRAKLADKP